ncbi:hypothetical protein ACWGVM_02285, partial [Streptomyces albidoflavus]
MQWKHVTRRLACGVPLACLLAAGLAPSAASAADPAAARGADAARSAAAARGADQPYTASEAEDGTNEG